MEGRLLKWTNVVRGWQNRWFVMDVINDRFSYYTSKEKMRRGIMRRCFKLQGAHVGICDVEDSTTFSITFGSKTVHLQAKNREERDMWIRCLEETISKHLDENKNRSSLELNSLLCSSTIQDFDKKLEESDGYLQIIIEQIKNIELTMVSTSDPLDKLKYEEIISLSKNTLEEAKNTIILLQIAKNAVIPEHSIYEPVGLVSTLNNISANPFQSNCLTSLASCVDDHLSFSSNGESEDFFDANDIGFRSHVKSEELNFQNKSSHSGNSLNSSRESSPSVTRKQINNEHVDIEQKSVTHVDTKMSINNSTFSSAYLKSDGQVDYDALYEDSYESAASFDNHGSIVAHLLSQVRVGMDLTKVALPIFILEPRSLLEMFADSFAHPDMFVKISDTQTEKERMVQVVKWYVCSYHAGRKCSLAKKPYNPILGEVFQCYWEVPGLESKSDSPKIEEGPVPWCNGNHLTFVAEQVSHHPPITAFYAEHFNKQISFTAFIWTKSKFLGLSIGVQNIGHGIINVAKFNENYVVTFPNGYGRSILTVPWIELGGPITISCEKTGYKATIEFLTKPFYGGKKHRIVGEVFGPNEKNPFLRLSGAWNGAIEAKWSCGKNELFANVDNLPIVKKIVRPIAEQDDMESRRLWKQVTTGLRLNNITLATEAKCEIEKKQRLEAQKRKELGTEWKTKLFKLTEDGNWMFVKPLLERLNKV